MKHRILILFITSCIAGLFTQTQLQAATQLSTMSKTVWAYAVSNGTVRSSPHISAPKIAILRYSTEGGGDETYRMIKQTRDTAGRMWTQIEYPKRPRAIRGWVLSIQLSAKHTEYSVLKIHRSTTTATLYYKGSKKGTARIGVGKSSTPTPSGTFYIRAKYTQNLSSIYGGVVFETSAYSSISDWPKGGIVALHGTNQPGILPGKVSHGCVRFKNADIQRFSQYLRRGTLVIIS